MYVGDWRDGSADEHALQIHRSNGAVRSYIGVAACVVLLLMLFAAGLMFLGILLPSQAANQ
jgi:hypothetical protein